MGWLYPNSAVRVLPKVPAGNPAAAAVPMELVTTTFVVLRRSEMTIRSRARPSRVHPGARNQPREVQTSESTEAATLAMASGDAITRAWPMAVAAASDVEVGTGTCPPKAVNPIWIFDPMPIGPQSL